MLRTSALLLAAAAAATVTHAAPVTVNSGFLGGVFGAYSISYTKGADGLQLQSIRFDLPSSLFLDPTIGGKGFAAPLAFTPGIGAVATGASASPILDGDKSFTLSFTDFNPGETFTFGLDVDSECSSIWCIVTASLVGGQQFAGTQITATFGGPQFLTKELSATFSSTGLVTAAASITGDVAPVPEPGTVALMLAGLGLVGISARLKQRG